MRNKEEEEARKRLLVLLHKTLKVSGAEKSRVKWS